MNITFLIGNGFDISLGLKTSYSEFAKYYIQRPSTHPSIEKLKTDIEKDILNGEEDDEKKWSDFEQAFGLYTENLSGIEECDIVYDDIVSEMHAYITQENERFDDVISKTPIIDDVFVRSCLSPDLFIRERTKVSKLFQNNIQLYFINFNYTTAFDRFAKSINWKFRNRGGSVVVDSKLYHVHGTLDTALVFGVNDTSQIANIEFQENPVISTQLVKPRFNQKLGYGIDEDCVEIIKKSDLICVYGMSMGVTDKYWWEQIIENLKSGNHYAILFQWSKKQYGKHQAWLQIREEDNIKANFLKHAGLGLEDSISNKIFIGYNTDIFKGIVRKE